MSNDIVSRRPAASAVSYATHQAVRMERLEGRRFFSAGAIDAGFHHGTPVEFQAQPTDDPFETLAAHALPGGGTLLVGVDLTSPNGADAIVLERLTAGGAPDASFGHAGRVAVPNVPFGHVAFDPQGRIDLLSGDTLYRINPDGTLDVTFGAGGVDAFTQRATTPNFTSTALAITPRGAILVGGYELDAQGYPTEEIVCLRADGRRSLAFGRRGIATGAPGGGVDAIAIGPDGAIVTADGYLSGGALTRFLPDGRLDTTFNGSGVLYLGVGDTGGHARDAVALDVADDGEVYALVGDEWANGGDWTAQLAQPLMVIAVSSGGYINASFARGGTFTGFVGHENWMLRPMSIRAEGDELIVAGFVRPPRRDGSSFVERIDRATGAPDDAFGTGGLAYLPPAAAGVASQAMAPLVIEGDTIVVPLTSYLPDNGAERAPAAVRLTNDGQLDAAWADGGTLTATSPAAQGLGVNALAADDAGVFGVATNESGSSGPTITRLTAQGTIDRGFGNRGRLRLAAADSFTALPGGQLLVGGPGSDAANTAFTLYNADGSIDAAFGVNGVATLPNAVDPDTGVPLSGVDPTVFARDDGTILIDLRGSESFAEFSVTVAHQFFVLSAAGAVLASRVGPSETGYDPRDQTVQTPAGGIEVLTATRGILRYAADLTPDATFAPARNGLDEAIAVQPDGGTIVQSADRTLTRLNADGTVDAAFAGGGSLTPPAGANLFAAQSDGKLLLTRVVSGAGVEILRYNADGTVDATFGNNGSVTVDPGNLAVQNSAFALAAAPQGGRLYIAEMTNGTGFVSPPLQASVSAIDL